MLAIAPAAIIPDDLCFNAHNFASKSDIVYMTDPTLDPSLTVDEVTIYRPDEHKENHRNLILLNPNENSKGLDHNFNSETYKQEIEKVITEYKIKNGNYCKR